MHSNERIVETLHDFFQGGERDGWSIRREDIAMTLLNALQTALYSNVLPKAPSRSADKKYDTNSSFWGEALEGRHFPTAYIVLEDFVLMEWLPFAPGRYYTPDAAYEREDAARCVSPDNKEYLPEGKRSMVRGGIGAIRLSERNINNKTFFFLGASSTGVAHQGIPIALPEHEYRKVIAIIKDHGGCSARIVGSLQTLTGAMPTLHYDRGVPRYCFVAEEVTPLKPASDNLLTTVAVMFTSHSEHHGSWGRGKDVNPNIEHKSWTFCSFRPGSSRQEVSRAADWLLNYAKRYSIGEPSILTDFDEQVPLFPCSVEFPLADIVRGTVNWETLKAYRSIYNGTYIENYYEEYIHMSGDQINVTGSHNIVVNRSNVENAFNKIKRAHDEETAMALRQVEKSVNESGKVEAIENFDAFTEELNKPEPKKSLLKSLWSGTLEVLPVIKELPGVVESITKIFS